MPLPQALAGSPGPARGEQDLLWFQGDWRAVRHHVSSQLGLSQNAASLLS